MKVILRAIVTCVSVASLVLVASPSLSSEWATEEVLKQLSELRVEVKKLRAEVSELSSVIRDSGKANAVITNEVEISGAPTLGDDSVNYAIVEFTDFQCPYCARHIQQTFPRINEKYIKTGKLLYISKQFPLDFHLQAKTASSAALCIEKQRVGGYWLAHDWFFSTEADFSLEGYSHLAEEVNVDSDLMKNCMADETVLNEIDEGVKAGASIGVSGTPAFYIGRIVDSRVVDGVLVRGAQPFQVFDRILSELVN